jgi:O-6-methylguanine DNA methyltransferase
LSSQCDELLFQRLSVLLNPKLDHFRTVSDVAKVGIDPPHHLLGLVPELTAHRVDADRCPAVERPESAGAKCVAEHAMSNLARDFDLPLAMAGSPFERRVWHALSRIPYGKTVSYGHIAASIGQPKACRAVGLANGKNPIPIVVPCQRSRALER